MRIFIHCLKAANLFCPLLQAFAAAAQALDPSAEDPAALSAARAALSALLATPQPLSDKLAAVSDLAGALQTLQAAGTTDSYIPDAVAALTSVRGVAQSAGAIAATLRALQGNYLAAAPCIAALLGRAQHVNTSVLVLPAEIDRPAALLADAEVRQRWDPVAVPWLRRRDSGSLHRLAR